MQRKQNLLRQIIREEVRRQITEASKLGTFEYLRDAARSTYDWTMKNLSFGTNALAVLPVILERTVPGVYDLDSFYVEQKGNQFYIYVNAKNDNIAIDYQRIERDTEFKKYFETGGINSLERPGGRKMTSYFLVRSV
jgi:hypothetical protein